MFGGRTCGECLNRSLEFLLSCEHRPRDVMQCTYPTRLTEHCSCQACCCCDCHAAYSGESMGSTGNDWDCFHRNTQLKLSHDQALDGYSVKQKVLPRKGPSQGCYKKLEGWKIRHSESKQRILVELHEYCQQLNILHKYSSSATTPQALGASTALPWPGAPTAAPPEVSPVRSFPLPCDFGVWVFLFLKRKQPFFTGFPILTQTRACAPQHAGPL